MGSDSILELRIHTALLSLLHIEHGHSSEAAGIYRRDGAKVS
jgi:hypothetical protein